jgi:hypothetical protein
MQNKGTSARSPPGYGCGKHNAIKRNDVGNEPCLTFFLKGKNHENIMDK